MVANQHPAGLNPLQRFRQAGAILRGTSRASNPAWYESALDLDLQLHLRVDGSAVESFLYDRKVKAWSPGPVFDEACATDPALIPAFAAQVLSTARGAGASSIGVVLHLADEFATSELKPELDNPGALAELRGTIADDPKAVLDDASVSAADSSWRLIPYPAAGSEAIANSAEPVMNRTPILRASPLAAPADSTAADAALIGVAPLGSARAQAYAGRPLASALG